MLENIKFQYYRNDVKSSKPSGMITYDNFIDAIRDPKKETKELLEKIANAAKEDDLKLKSELKKGLYAFTPGVRVKNNRSYEGIIDYTGLAVLDFDKIDNAYEFKEFLFNEYKCISLCWISPSKKGVKALVKIPIVKSKAEFKSYSWGLCSELEIYKGFDVAVNNAVLLLFIGYDPDILIRDNPETWTQKGIQASSFDLAKVKTFIPSDKITDKQTDWVINWFKDGINGIYDNGHPQVRGYCIALGGYVGGGYISQYDAINLAESLITQNGYLQKGISGYQQTARQAVVLGTNKPLIFN